MDRLDYLDQLAPPDWSDHLEPLDSRDSQEPPEQLDLLEVLEGLARRVARDQQDTQAGPGRLDQQAQLVKLDTLAFQDKAASRALLAQLV
jgi:hypothetical protein